MRSICLLDKNNPAAGQLPDMELAKNREEVLALSRGPGDCFLFLRQQDIENDFIQKVKENNPGCRVIMMMEAAPAGMVLPYAWQGYIDGVYFLHGHDGEEELPAAEMFKDILSMEYIHDLIYGHLERLTKLQPMFGLMEIEINPQIILTIVYDDFWTICEHHHNSYRYKMKRNLLNRTREVLRLGMKGIATTLIGTDKVVVVLDCGGRKGEQAEDYATACAEMIRDHLIRETGYSVSIGVSSFCDTKGFLWRAYEQSFRALEHSFQKGRGQVLHYRQSVPVYGDEGASESEQFSHDLIIAVSLKNEKYGEGVLERFMNLTISRNMGASYVKSLAVTILSETAQYCMRIGIDAAEISGSLINVVNRIFKAATVKDIKGEMQLFLQFAINRVRALSDGGGVLDIAKAYIEQYYMMDLDLDKVASICGYSPSYFSRSFRKYFGINFVQYLLQVRLDNAKQLLKSSSMTVAEISEKTGFQSLSYFSTIFKRETGLSPNQYRIG